MPTRYTRRTVALKGLPVLRVVRKGDRHRFHDLSIDVQLDLDTSEDTAPDPDSFRRAIYALAAHPAVAEPEAFAHTIAQHCSSRFDTVRAVIVEVSQHSWHRLDLSGRPRDRDLVGPAAEVRVARVVIDQDTRTCAGFRNMQLMTSSGPEPHPLILMRLDALWTYGWAEVPFDTQWQQVRRAFTEAYLERAQIVGAQLASALARAVLDESPAVHDVEVRLEVTRRQAIDMNAFGMENTGEVFGDSEAARTVHEVIVQRGIAD